jgi:hypothetical protein
MTPLVKVGKAAEDVHVFRVDVNTKWGLPALYDEESYSLRRILLIAGTVPPQVKAGVDTGIIMIGVALNYHFHYHNGCHVRIYRPGFELVEFKSWQFGKPLEWKAARTLVEQEKAIDQLMAKAGTPHNPAIPGEEQKQATEIPASLRPGSFSEQHKAALLFAASEYERLATLDDPSRTEADTQRLLDKAQQLQALANQ